MKKTIITTLAMLIIFGGAVIFGAGRVSTDWQKPNEDDVEISVVSPVENVENAIKEYTYNVLSKENKRQFFYTDGEYPVSPAENVFEQADVQQGMITYAEAVGYGASAMEKLWTDVSFDSSEFIIALEKMKTYKEGEELHKNGVGVNFKFYRYLPQYAFIGRNIENDKVFQYYVDAYTGRILSLYRIDEDLFDEATMLYPVYNEYLCNEKTEEIIYKKANELLNILGYAEAKVYDIATHSIYYGPSDYDEIKGYNGYIVNAVLQDDTIISFIFYDNADKTYPLYSFNNYSGLYDEIFYKHILEKLE